MNLDPVALEQWLQQLLEARAVPGAAVALVRDGEVEVITAGLRDAISGEPVDAETVFDAASLSKPMVAYAVLHGAWLRQATWREWLVPVAHVPIGAAIHLEPEPAATEKDVAWGLGWGVEISRGTFFQWGKTDGVRAFAMGSVAEQAGLALFTNGNTGLRLLEDLTGLVLPGAHPAIVWLACVTEED